MTIGPFDVDGESPWSITVRDVDMNEVQFANGYERLRLDLVDSGIGEWSLRLATDHPAAIHMLEPGAGIVVRPRGLDTVVTSGPVADLFITEDRDTQVSQITANGFTDDILLSELIYIDPTDDVPTGSTTTYSFQRASITATNAETALKQFVADNIGPTAGISRRRYPFLNIPASQGLGPVGTWRSRFGSLLEMCQRIVTYAGLSFRIVQSAQGQLTLEVWEPEIREDVRFSTQAQNLTSAVLSYRAPNLTEVIVGGEGEGVNRIFTRRTVPGLADTWGRRVSKFMSRASIDNYNELQQEAETELVEGAVTAGMTLYPIEQTGTLYGVDYQLGDSVAAVVHDVELVEPVRRVVIEHEAGSAPDIQPNVGLPNTGQERPEDAPLIRSIINNLSSLMRS